MEFETIRFEDLLLNDHEKAAQALSLWTGTTLLAIINTKMEIIS